MSRFRSFTCRPFVPDDFAPADHMASAEASKRLLDTITDADLRARLMAEASKPADIAKRTKARFDRRRASTLYGRKGGFSGAGNA